MNDLIEINVETTYLSSESNPDENKYYFLYTVLIKNNSLKKTKLLSRHWVIRDDNGKIQDVKGEGVIGEQPDINPGEEFQYTSGTMIETSLGTMKGSYQMIDDEDNYFDAIIPEFVLTVPRVIH
jgi:ApaG protein|tara:strand:- start:907 stop:1278 length:372 start_codon:yes stop_codon:yes gene_type:complete